MEDVVELAGRRQVAPNGFSMITRAFFAQLDEPSPSTTVSNMLGGIAR